MNIRTAFIFISRYCVTIECCVLNYRGERRGPYFDRSCVCAVMKVFALPFKLIPINNSVGNDTGQATKNSLSDVSCVYFCTVCILHCAYEQTKKLYVCCLHANQHRCWSFAKYFRLQLLVRATPFICLERHLTLAEIFK